MQLEHRSAKLLITGRSGTGKSTYWTRYLVGSKASLKCAFDHEGELGLRLRVRPATTPNEIARQSTTGWILYDPARMFPGRLLEGFDFFCEFAFRACASRPGRKLVVCDELQKLVGTNRVTPELACILETGRRYGIDVAMVAQQPNLIHNRIQNQLSEVVTFQQMHERALEFLEAAGFNADQVRALRPGQWIARNLNTGGETSGSVF